MPTLRHTLIVLWIGLAVSACSTAVLPPVQGPAVRGDGIVIDDWQYFGPEAVKEHPPESANVEAFGTSEYKAWLIWTDAGFDLVWGQVRCATQPVVVVHVDAIEFWPGKTPDCEAMRVYHKLNVAIKTEIPREQWHFTLHPPSN